MEENKVLKINTVLDTKEAESGLGQFVNIVKKITELTNAIVTDAATKMKFFAEIGTVAQRAAKGQQALAKATQAAGKAAKGTLASFDQLNVLQQKSAVAGGGGGSGGGSKPKPKPDTPTGEELLVVQVLTAALEELDKLLERLQPAATWLWENFLQPLGQWSGEVVVAALGGIAGVLETVSGWIEDNKEKLLGLWETVEPLLTVISETVTGLFDGIRTFFDVWCVAFTETLTGMLDFWLGLLTDDWEQAWGGIVATFDAYKELLLTGLGLLWEGLKNGFKSAFEAVKIIWAPIGAWFMAQVMTPLQTNFGWLWEGIATAGDICLQALKAIWEPLAAWFGENIATPVGAVIGQMWDDIWSSFVLGFTTVLGASKDFINLQMELFESGANVMVGMLNKIIDALNTIQIDIPSWVPKYGGNSFGVNIPHAPTVTMPRLATGAVIPPNAQFAAILGDQRNGRNLEAPEGLIREIVREESGGNREIIIRFEGNMAQFVRLLKPELAEETQRQGARLIPGGVG